MQKIHLDTDLGGDLDDLCALAMLLRWSPALHITGITVVGDTQGKRTGMVRKALEIAERSDIPVAAGAETSQGFYPYELGLPPEKRYWPQPITPSPNPPEQAIECGNLLMEDTSQSRVLSSGPLEASSLNFSTPIPPGILQRRLTEFFSVLDNPIRKMVHSL